MDSTFAFSVGAVVLVSVIVVQFFYRRSGWNVAEIRDLVAALVQAAEQMMPGQNGAQKLEWVLAQADEAGVTKFIHPTLLRAMIESAVYWLGKSQPASATPPNVTRFLDRG